MTIELLQAPASGPYEIQLTIGRFPFDWQLFDYAPSGGSWSCRALGSGSNVAWLKLPDDYSTAADLQKHRLVWSVQIINLDTRIQSTDLEIILESAGKPGATPPVVFTVDVDPLRPYFFIAVDVK